MKKLSTESVCEVFNKLRLENLGRRFSSKELDDLLASKFNRHLCYELKKVFFNVEKNDKGIKTYFFQTEPAYKKKVGNCLEAYRKKAYTPVAEKVNPKSDEQCIAQLRAAGYQIQKPIGFDEVRFANEHPDLYKQYMLYGEV